MSIRSSSSVVYKAGVNFNRRNTLRILGLKFKSNAVIGKIGGFRLAAIYKDMNGRKWRTAE